MLNVPSAWEYNSTSENSIGKLLEQVGSLDQAVADATYQLLNSGRFVGAGEELDDLGQLFDLGGNLEDVGRAIAGGAELAFEAAEARGEGPTASQLKSNRMMQQRIFFQALAITVVVLLLFMAGRT